jgi:hypothetical protein
MEPRGPDSLTQAQTGDAARHLFDDADNLVSGNYGRKFFRELAFDDVKVSSTNSANAYAQQDLAGGKFGPGQISNNKWPLFYGRRSLKQTSLHRQSIYCLGSAFD